MDNLVSQGQGATRLNFAQKAIATGMSVILAFGLSPLGQVPAYAATNGGDSAPAITTQTMDATANVTWEYELNTLVYQGKVNAATDFTLTSGDNGVLTSMQALADTGSESKRYTVSLKNIKDDVATEASDDSVAEKTGLFKIFEADTADPKKASKKEVAEADLGANGVPYHAGNYVIQFKVPAGSTALAEIKGASGTIPFTISALDVTASNVEVKADDYSPYAAGGKIAYTGKAADFKAAITQMEVKRAADAEEGIVAIDETIDPTAPSHVSDYEIDPLFQTKTEPGAYDVVFNLTGDFTGSVTVPLEVTRIGLRNSNVKINGVAVDDEWVDPVAPATTGHYKNAEVAASLYGITSQSPDDADSPIESIVVGERTLTEGVDYAVYYVDSEGNESTVKPTEYGTYKIAIKTVNGSKYLNEYGAGHGLVDTTFTLTGFTIANKSKSFDELGVVSATVEGGSYNGGLGVAATNAKFFDEYGHDITADVDGNYTILDYVPWTPAMEKTYRGASVFNALYGTTGYDNSNTYDAFEEKTGKPTAAGDYGVIILSTGKEGAGGTRGSDVNAAKETVSAPASLKVAKEYVGDVESDWYTKTGLIKMTVDPAEVVQGTADGQVNIVTSNQSSWSDEYNKNMVISTKGAVTNATPSNVPTLATVEYIKDATKTVDTDRKKDLVAGTDYDLTFAYADGTAIEDDGDPMQVGTYTATLKFKGNFKGTVKLDSAYSVKAFDLSKYLSAINMKETTYTGSTITPADVETSGTVIAANDWTLKDPYVKGTPGTGKTEFTADQIDTLNALSADDITWTGSPYNPTAAFDDYTLTVTGKGNFTGSVKDTKFEIAKLDISTGTILQFRNPGEVNWTDAGANDAGATFAVALGEDGKAVPPEVRLAVKDTVTNKVKQVEDADGNKTDVVIPAAAYGNNPTYSNNAKVSTDTVAGKATVKASTNESFVSGNDAEGYFKVVSAEDTAAGKGYSIEAAESATYNGKVQDPNTKVYQTVEGTKVEAAPSSYTAIVTVKSTGDSYNLKTGTKIDPTTGADMTVSPGEDLETITTDGVFLHADTYTMAVTFDGLAGSLVSTYTIDPLAVTQADVQSNANLKTGLVIYNAPQNYDASGNDFAATTVVKYNDVAIPVYSKGAPVGYSIDEKEFKVKAVGEYEGTYEFKGDITGTVKQSFEVRSVNITSLIGSQYFIYFDGVPVDGTNASDLSVDNYKFDGIAKTPEITLVKGATQVATADDMRVEYVGDNVNVGSFVVNILFTGGNYSGTAVVKAGIDPVDINMTTGMTVEFTDEELAYTGSAVQPKGKLTMKNAADGYVLREGVDYTIKYGTPATQVGEKGTVIYEATSTGNFWTGKGKREVEFEVKAAADVKVEAPTAKTGLKYTGKAQTGVAAATGYTVANGSATKAGNYTATATLQDGYVWADGSKDAKTITWSIAQIANPLKIANRTATVKYAKVKKAAQKITGVKLSKKGQGTVTYKVTKVTKSGKSIAKSNFKLAKSTANKLTVKKGLAKGTYKVTMTAKAKGNTNYKASSTLKKVVTVKVK